jgi:hypothetical protein
MVLMNEITAASFDLASCQATLFTPDEEVSSVKLLRDLVPRWLRRFDDEPVVLPLREGMPREIPRLILRSKDGVWRCEIASARINFHWRRARQAPQVPTLSELFTVGAETLADYADFIVARVGRMAAVLNRFASHSSPGRFLAQHFCHDRWLSTALNRPESFELHAHKRFTLTGGFVVNSWFRSKTGKISPGAEKEPGESRAEEGEPVVLVEQDLNTLHEETSTRSYSKADIEQFFGAVADEFDTILKLYYFVGD